MTQTFLISSERDRNLAIAAISRSKTPFTVKLSEGVDRSAAQNRLAHLWFREVSDQTGATPDEIRADCKLTIAVPIMRHEDEDFRKLYDEMVRPLPLAHKLALMLEPFDLAVTRNMTTKQMSKFLDEIWRKFAVEMGLQLTEPDPAVCEIPDHAA